ncbi:CapA family protein [Prosthecobacter sp.]|uniref:CapA family protein n=1 Tax=Prosthecobacter sp. TaxID=1965333 RepID=UPI002ABB4376|nr:CapA family protein [Prosthecobacter sp.]MDZ4403624.1 CapA family protein [Prosthecobacter sp.]
MNNPLKLLLVGDVMLGRQVNEHLRDQPPEYPWGNTLPLFLGADWRACNLECVITDHGSPWARSPKAYHFQTDAKNLAALKAARMDAVSLANNHTLDFNHRGMVEMLRLLDGAHVAHSGAGLNREEATQLAVSEVRGVRIGFISFTDNEPAWDAGEDHPGIFYVPVETNDERTAELINKVHQARSQVDVLIVAAHWGGNWGAHPRAQHTTLAHGLIRAGADVIFGHSAHVCRGIEVFEGGLILYSTGDFVDDYAIDPIERNDRSWIFEILVEGKQITHLHLFPTVIRECQARLAEPVEAGAMITAMQELCAPFGTVSTASAGSDRLVIDVLQHAGINREPVASTK